MIGLSAVGRLGLQSFRPAGNVYGALLRAGLIAARSTDTAMWFVADDLSNVWQDSAGTIPCTVEGQPVGFLADQQYRAAGPELVTTQWQNAAGWTAGNGASIEFVGGELLLTSAATGATVASLAIPGGTVAGKTYRVQMQIRSPDGREVAAHLINSATSGTIAVSPSITSSTFVDVAVTGVALDSQDFVGFRINNALSAGQRAAVRNVSVREVLSELSTTMLGPELVTNGEFTSNTSGWTVSGTTMAAVSGELEVTAGAGVWVSQSITVIPGRQYVITGRFRRGTNTGAAFRVGPTVTSQALVDRATTMTGPVDVVAEFTPTTTTIVVTLGGGSATPGATNYFDSISVREIQPLATTILGPELVPGGDGTNTTGWVGISASLAATSGVFRLTSTISGTGARVADYAITGLVVGRTYQILSTFVGSGGAAAPTPSQCQTSVTLSGGSGAQGQAIPSAFGQSAVRTFVASATTHVMRMRFDAGSGSDSTTYADFDNISVREVIPHTNSGALGPNMATTTSIDAVAIGGPAFTNYSTGAFLAAGKTYVVSFDVQDYAGSGTVNVGGIFGTTWESPGAAGASINGPYSLILRVLQSTALNLFSRSTNTCKFRNISVRELPGYHATQPTAGNRPTLVRLANGRWGLNFGGSNILIVPTPAPSGTGFVGAAARQANIPANNISRILLTIRDGSYSANYRNPQLRATGDTSGSARITVMWRGGGVSSGEVSTANEIALETFLASSVQDAGLSRLWRNGALVNSIASTAAGDGGDNPPSYLGWSALGGWQGTIGTAWSSRNAPADSNRIAIERFAAAHSGAPYSA